MKKKTSNYIGVKWDTYSKKWQAYFSYKKKRYYVGYFDDENDAAKARDVDALKICGDNIRLNFPCSEPEITIPNTKWIILTRGKFALVDEKNYKWLNQWKWYANYRNGTWYALRIETINGKHVTIGMHRIILGATDNKIYIDHINHNGLDNREVNIRLCLQGQNAINKRVTGNGTSKYKGVRFNRDRFEAKIRVNNIHYYLGSSKDELQMARRYNMAAKWFHGEWACLNDIDD